MPSSHPESPHRLMRSNFFWGLLGALALGQLMALWLLCSHEVRKAEVRRTEVIMQQMALADCLRYIQGATIGSCVSRIAEAPPPPREPASLMARDGPAVTPVGYSR